jgi:hypothetical protein
MSKKEQVQLEAVFRLKPIKTEENSLGECEIKLAGYVSPTDKLGDEPIEIKTSEKEIKVVGKDTLLMNNINGYDITVNAYRNNIIGNFLLKNKELPVCSLQFMYSKNIVVGYLFNVYIYFKLDPKKNYFLKSPKDYVGAKVYGKYYIMIDGDKELLDNFDDLLNNSIEKYSLEDVAKQIGNSTYSEEHMMELLQKDIKEKRDFYEMLIKGKEVFFKKNFTKMVEEYLFPIFNNKHIIGLIKFALETRAKKRIKEYGAFDGEYKIPEKVLNVNNIKNNPESVNNYINSKDEYNTSDSDSDSDSNFK